MPFYISSLRAASARSLLTLFAFTLLAPNIALRAAPVTRIVAVTGQPAPDGNGILSSFPGQQTIFLNDSGQVAFTASLTKTSGGKGTLGAFRGDGSNLNQIARRDQTLPGGIGILSSVLEIGGLNNAGQVAFLSSVTGSPGPDSIVAGIFVGDGQQLQTIARAVPVQPGGFGNLLAFDVPTGINESGQVAFLARLQSNIGEVGDTGVYLGDGTTLTQIALEGRPSPNGSELYPDLFGSRVMQGVNNRGQVVFGIRIPGLGGGDTLRVSHIYRSDGTTAELIAQQRQPAPDATSQYSYFTKSDTSVGPANINASGQVAFLAITSAPGASGYEGVFLASGDGTKLIARTGQTVPDGNGQISHVRDISGLTDSGHLALLTDLAGTSAGTANNSAIYRTDGDALLQIARTGQTAPGGIGNFEFLTPNPSVSEAGHVAFQATLDGAQPAINQGVFLFDESLGLVKVAQTGDSLLGSSITSVLAVAGGGRGGGSSLMNVQVNLDKNGQPVVTYGFRLADGRTGIALWSLVPEPGSLAIVGVGAAVILLVSGWPPRSKRRDSTECVSAT
jgi:hypothetical protein